MQQRSTPYFSCLAAITFAAILSSTITFLLGMIAHIENIYLILAFSILGTALFSSLFLHILLNKPLAALAAVSNGGSTDTLLPGAIGMAIESIGTLRNDACKTEHLFTAILSSLAGTCPFITTDSQGNITRLDEGTISLLGHSGSPASFLCKPASTLLSNTGNTSSIVTRTIREKQPISEEVFLGQTGTPRIIKILAEPLFAPDKTLIGVCVSCSDLTEQRDREKEAVAEKVRLTDLLQEIINSAQQVNNASEQLAERIQSANEGATRQQHRTTETATAMEQMNATVMEVARSASDAAEFAVNTRKQSSEGADRMSMLESNIKSVGSVISKLGERISDLGTRAVDIGLVMNVINDIADQTNLLALNAAIEAARAGDAGRGFAVVADEVRKLAEKTMHATSEVGGAIHSIQESSKAATDEMKDALTAVENVTASAHESGEALRQIVQLADHTSAQVQSIATAAEEQSATSEQINGAVEEITRIATDTMQAMNKAATDVFSLTGRASDLNLMITRMQQSDCESGAQGKSEPCWVHKGCGREKGGKKEKEMGICPAWPNHGFSCASVTGTYCGGVIQETFAKKIANCAKCDYFKSSHYDRQSIHNAFDASPAKKLTPLTTRRK